MPQKLWIVGKRLDIPSVLSAWEFQGVFSREDLAVFACKSANYFVGPAVLDRELPDSSTGWADAYYPLLELNDD